MQDKDRFILLTVDVEDWFQVENFKQVISFDDWPHMECRVEQNTRLLLDLFDEALFPGKVRATFFVLGWLAERYRGLVREIADRGHEIASHGFSHHLCTHQTPEKLAADLSDAKKLLEDITGQPVRGYRAPSFSINGSVLDIVAACGYTYDSSYNSFALHGRYGSIDLPATGGPGIAAEISKGFYELPVSNLTLGGRVIPLGGGGYFRLFPLSFFSAGVSRILKQDSAYLFYMHPWEFDPGQPRVKGAGALSRFRHYVNLSRSAKRLSAMIRQFKTAQFIPLQDYLETTRGVRQS